MGERVELTEEHRHLVRQALEQIEHAQSLVLLAAENLSTVSGLPNGKPPLNCTSRSRLTGTRWRNAWLGSLGRFESVSEAISGLGRHVPRSNVGFSCSTSDVNADEFSFWAFSSLIVTRKRNGDLHLGFARLAT